MSEPTTPPATQGQTTSSNAGSVLPATPQDNPKAGNLATDVLFKLFPDDAQPILDLFTKPFEPDALWKALEAAGKLGKLAADFLANAPSPVKAHQAVGAKTIMNDELVMQFQERVQKSQPVATGTAAASGGRPAVAMDPVFASLIVTLAQRVAVELINRFGG